jgi:hypothetical protein
MHTATLKMKTNVPLPVHSFGGAIAAIRLVKTNQDVPRRAIFEGKRPKLFCIPP